MVDCVCQRIARCLSKRFLYGEVKALDEATPTRLVHVHHVIATRVYKKGKACGIFRRLVMSNTAVNFPCTARLESVWMELHSVETAPFNTVTVSKADRVHTIERNIGKSLVLNRLSLQLPSHCG